jgi:hypothetical protein
MAEQIKFTVLGGSSVAPPELIRALGERAERKTTSNSESIEFVSFSIRCCVWLRLEAAP